MASQKKVPSVGWPSKRRSGKAPAPPLPPLEAPPLAGKNAKITLAMSAMYQGRLDVVAGTLTSLMGRPYSRSETVRVALDMLMWSFEAGLIDEKAPA